MKNLQQINDDIVKITTIINKQYPELVKYVNEMPDTIADEDKNDSKEESELKRLKEYYDSLLAMVLKYSATHDSNPIV